MDDFLLQKLGKVAIGAKDDVCVVLDDEDIRPGLLEYSRSVVDCLYGSPDCNVLGFKMAMERTWSCDPFTLQQLGHNFFQIFFVKADTVDYVLHSSP